MRMASAYPVLRQRLAAIDVIRFSETSRARRTCAWFQRLVSTPGGIKDWLHLM